jgi:hypothetical protein
MEEIDFYKNALARIAGLFDIDSPLELIVRAENNEETYVDILCRVISEKLNNSHNNYLEAIETLKYVRRFLDKKDIDIDYVDATLAKAKELK